MDSPTRIFEHHGHIYMLPSFFCKRIDALSNIKAYILVVVNHILTFISLNSPMEIFAIEVIKKLMDIDPPNRIIWNLGTNPSLCSLLLAQRSSLNPSPE
jgi:hypothetical protein